MPGLPVEFSRFIAEETEKYGWVIRTAKIRGSSLRQLSTGFAVATLAGFARRRAPAAQRPEQPGGKLPPTDPAASADHEAVQVAAAGATVSFHP